MTTAAGAPQRAGAVGDEGTGSAGHHTGIDTDHRTQVVAGHWQAQSPLL